MKLCEIFTVAKQHPYSGALLKEDKGYLNIVLLFRKSKQL
jgi:hypothetical protein